MAVAPFREIERSYFDLRWHLDPVAATQAGVKTYDDRYGRFSPIALAPHLVALKSMATALEETTTDQLEDEIDRTALLNEIRVMLRRFERERPQAKNPAFWLSHLLGGLHFLLGRRDRTAEEKAAALAGRLEDLPRFLDDARSALVEPIRVFVETALRINQGGAALIRAGWSDGSFDLPTEQAILQKDSALLTQENDRARLDALLWRLRVVLYLGLGKSSLLLFLIMHHRLICELSHHHRYDAPIYLL